MLSYHQLQEIFSLFEDPIDNALLKDPITRPETGITYSRSSYTDWVRIKPVDPVSRQVVNDLVPVQTNRLIPQLVDKLRDTFKDSLLSERVLHDALKDDNTTIISLALDCGLIMRDGKFQKKNILREAIMVEAEATCMMLHERDNTLLLSERISSVLPYCFRNHKRNRVIKWVLEEHPAVFKTMSLDKIVVDKIALKRFFKLCEEERALEFLSEWFRKTLRVDAAKGNGPITKDSGVQDSQLKGGSEAPLPRKRSSTVNDDQHGPHILRTSIERRVRKC
mmetsp:Transcript_3210/g.12266  ORF Transcript_3210/g.12266 Transcript_3210/m.12266 type:complete len:279 (-) Transcript_3210:231-1067(-)